MAVCRSQTAALMADGGHQPWPASASQLRFPSREGLASAPSAASQASTRSFSRRFDTSLCSLGRPPQSLTAATFNIRVATLGGDHCAGERRRPRSRVVGTAYMGREMATALSGYQRTVVMRAVCWVKDRLGGSSRGWRGRCHAQGRWDVRSSIARWRQGYGGVVAIYLVILGISPACRRRTTCR